MCLILFAYKVHPKNDLIVLANRDEFYERPTENAHWWNDELLAGKDLKGNGTWLGVTKHRKFAALTNFRDPKNFDSLATSRGKLVIDYLQKDMNNDTYKKQYLADLSNYNDFNLLLYQKDILSYFNSIKKDFQILQPGIYGLSNAFLESDWFKVRTGKAALQNWLNDDVLNADKGFEILSNPTQAADDDLPETGMSSIQEKFLSPMHIDIQGYGTRSSNVVFFRKDGKIALHEKNHLTKEEYSFVF